MLFLIYEKQTKDKKKKNLLNHGWDLLKVYNTIASCLSPTQLLLMGFSFKYSNPFLLLEIGLYHRNI